MKPSMREALQQVREADAWLVEQPAVPIPVPARGLEAVIAGGFLGLERTDWVFPGLRERVGAVLRGCPRERLVDGRGGARPWRVAPVSASPANRLLLACGLAMARPDDAVLVFLGEGSASCGAFHEALNLAALHDLRVIFLVHVWDVPEDASPPYAPQLAADPTALALAHGVGARQVDGGLVNQVLSAVAEARAHAGPRLVECRLTPGDDPIRRAWEELTETDPAVTALEN